MTVTKGEMTDDAFDAQLASEMAQRTAKLKDNTIDLALRVKEAREFLTWSNNHLRGSWLDWIEQAGGASKEILQFRMAYERETKHVLATGKDIATFFNSPEYQQAHATLKETIALLEKVRELKETGALDALSDFILKVSCSK